MVKKRILVTDIISLLGDSVLNVCGDPENKYIDNVSDIEHVTDTTLDWINPVRINKQDIAENSIARTLIVSQDIEFTENISKQGKVLIVVSNPKKSLIDVISKYFVTRFEPRIDSSAYIHPNAKIGKNNYIGPNCYIGECVIGDNNIIHSNVSIYDRTVIGDNNVIHSGALLCVDGLGCIRDKDTGALIEFPQMGGVKIGNNCYIGGNTHIASGSLSDTIIEDGCKINGLCFIGSNDHLNKNVWISCSTALAGSVKVGKNTTIYSHAVVRDWTTIGEGCTIGMGSVVTKQIPDGETWFGSPAKKHDK